MKEKSTVLAENISVLANRLIEVVQTLTRTLENVFSNTKWIN